MWHSAAEPLKVKGDLYLLQKIYLQTKFYAKSERRFYGNEIRFFTVLALFMLSYQCARLFCLLSCFVHQKIKKVFLSFRMGFFGQVWQYEHIGTSSNIDKLS